MQADDLLRVWWLVAAMLVFMMQVGFLLLETGLIQERHMAGIAVKSMMMLLASSMAYTVFGYDYMWKNSHSPHVTWGEWQFYQTGFAAVTAAILSGSMAGRTTLISNVVMSFIVGGLIFPLHGRWVWGDGFLSVGDLKVHDFAGSGCIHLLGGLVALAGAQVGGPRQEKRDMPADGPMHLSPRSLPMAACGVLFLWIGWMGFNGGSIQDATEIRLVGRLVLSTGLAASAGGFAVCIAAGCLNLVRKRGYVFSPYATLSGIMAGMVANSACCDLIARTSLNWSIVVGSVAGLVASIANTVLQRVYRIDDPIEAVAVHAGGGVVGLICAGLLQSPVALWPQVADIAVLIVVAYVPAWILFKAMHVMSAVRFAGRTPMRLKSTASEEDIGLTFDDPSTRIGEPPVRIHYLPRDLQKQLQDCLLLLTSMPLHAARGLSEAATNLISTLRAKAPAEIPIQLELDHLELLSEELRHRIDIVPDILERLTTRTGEPISLRPLVEEITSEYRARYGAVVTIVADCGGADLWVWGDPALLREALRMIISNGVKACIQLVERKGLQRYAPTVVVEAGLDESRATRQVHVSVRDNGEGIDSEIRHYLGQPFAGINRAGRGSGLGLFFAAYITRAFHGELHCMRSAPRTTGEAEPSAPEWTEFVMMLNRAVRGQSQEA